RRSSDLYSVVTNPSHGTLSGSGATRTYTPAANYNGPDSFTFKVNDGALDSGSATVSITVNAVNDAPLANAQAKSVIEDTATSITLTGSDVEGSTLTYTVVTNPSHGTLSGSGATRTYTPAANYNGPDSFTFRVNDGTINSLSATVTITVTPVNDAPVGVGDQYYVNSNMKIDTNNDGIADIYRLTVVAPGILQNDTDIDLDVLTASLKTSVTKGTLVLNSNGSFTYTPNQSLLQDTDSFVYTLSDGHGGSVDVTVNITIDRIPPSPVAQWLEPVTALAGSSNYYGITYDASTATVPLKVFVDGISDVAKVEFRWYDHTQSPGVWQIIGSDETPTQESGKNVYTALLNMDLLPFVDQIQVWAYTYDAAGNYTRIVKVNGFDYWARILVNHNPSGYNVF
ncbi:MAG: tandem-95 repeat protein, partial [Bellilinea sp.]